MSSFQSRREVNQKGKWIVILTLFAFSGIFFRDIIIARFFGINAELDSLFLALAIPTFFINVLTQSYGQAVLPPFQHIHVHAGTAERQSFVSESLTFILFILLLLSIILFFFPNFWLTLFLGERAVLNIDILSYYLRFSLPILVLGGVTILGNSLLNAIGKSRQSAGSQIVLSFGTIVFLFPLLPRLGISGVILSMIIGQVFNLLIIIIFCSKEGYPFWGLKIPSPSFFKRILSEYIHLSLSAIASAMMLPFLQFLASRLQEGSVGALTLGNKLTLFATHLASLTMNFVLLPYFSELIIRKNKEEASKELSYYLIYGTFFSIVFSLIVFLSTPLLVKLLFLGGKLTAQDSEKVSAVMRFGVIQIPFFIIFFLIQKYAAAGKKSFPVLISSVVALLATLFWGGFLSPIYGLMALASTLPVASFAGAICLICFLARQKDIKSESLLLILYLLGFFLLITWFCFFHFYFLAGFVFICLLILFKRYMHQESVVK